MGSLGCGGGGVGVGGEQYSRRLERMGSLGCGGGGGVGWGGEQYSRHLERMGSLECGGGWVNSTHGTWREWSHWSVGVGG